MSHMFDLSGKVAIVTGSSRGIGRAIAEGLAHHGAKVVISSRKQDACEEVAKAINDEHGDERAIAIAASISDKDALQALGRRDEAAARQDRHPRLQRGVKPLLRADGRDYGRPVPQDSRQ
jgi:NAD(P)-dependent dehydrogenase (short-subunit alcohol dehydrogenase family)